uniref:PH domain-containing protein n=1 Tax=Anopheles melas TaxID=34690 RepID=A0A182TIJ8_9DIPT
MSETPMPGMAKPATPTPLLGPSVVVPGGVVVAPAIAAVAAATVPAATVNAAAAASLASGNPNGGSSTSVAAAASQAEPDMKGWLLKWTNYLKGYQKRWFVLSKGVLSYYRNQAEMAHTCRGTISLHGALIHTVDSCTFVISNGGTQTFHIKAANEVERQSWVTALELAKAKAIRAMESDEEEEDNTANTIPSEELNLVVRELTVRLENLKTCYDLITKHGAALQRALSELETGDDLANKTKIVSERATLFRISSNAMINACSDYLQTAQTQGHKWSKMLQHERDQKLHLEEMVEQLARQHSHLEQAATRHRPSEYLRESTTTTTNGNGDCADHDVVVTPFLYMEQDSPALSISRVEATKKKNNNCHTTHGEGKKKRNRTLVVLARWFGLPNNRKLLRRFAGEVRNCSSLVVNPPRRRFTL